MKALLSRLAGALLPPAQPVLVVDMAHCKVQDGDQKGIDYRLKATPSLLLDTRSFDIGQSLYPGVWPNVVHLILADEIQYLAPIDPSGTTEVSAR